MSVPLRKAIRRSFGKSSGGSGREDDVGGGGGGGGELDDVVG